MSILYRGARAQWTFALTRVGYRGYYPLPQDIITPFYPSRLPLPLTLSDTLYPLP